MTKPSPLTSRVLSEVRRLRTCDLDTLRQRLTDLTWNQVFMEIDRLSRAGEVVLTFARGGNYIIRLPEGRKPTPRPST